MRLPKTTPFKMRVVKENEAISHILPVRSKDMLPGFPKPLEPRTQASRTEVLVMPILWIVVLKTCSSRGRRIINPRAKIMKSNV